MTEGTIGPVEAGALLVGAKPPAEIQSAIPDARSAANSGAHRRLSASHRGQPAFATPHQHF